MSEQSDVIDTSAAANPLKSEPEMKKKAPPDDIGDVNAEAMKEPEEADHQAQCHILNPTLSEGVHAPDTEKEKGELDTAAESEKKEEPEGWLFVLGHDLLKKRVLKEGGDFSSRPSNGQMVSISYKATLYEAGDEVVDSADTRTFTLGDGDVIMAFDLCVALMSLGEVCEVVTDAKYAYGATGKQPSIPANASLHYEIELLAVKDAPKITELSAVERARKANEKREKGNGLYAKTEYSEAISAYTKALQYVDTQYDVTVKEDAQLKLLQDTRLKCYNNLAAAQLKLEAWDAAIKSTNQVLRVQPKNVKALFRKGKCLAGKGDTSRAIATLREALHLEPETKDRGYKIIHQELSRLVNRQKRQEESERQMYQRMIGADKEQPTPKKSKVSLSANSMLTVGALVTGLVAVGLGMYRYLHNL